MLITYTSKGMAMNMNDDNFFDDMQDEVQENDIGGSRSYQDDKNKKTKLVLTVIVSFAIGLLLLGILLFFLSGDKDDDMVAINSLQPSIQQSQVDRNPDMDKGIVKINDNSATPSTLVAQSRVITQNSGVEEKPLTKKTAKRVAIASFAKKKKTVIKPVKVNKKPVLESKPILKGAWKVQLMSAQDRDNNPVELKNRMDDAWKQLVSENSILKGHLHDIEQTNIKGVTWYRLRVIGLKNSAEAASLCSDLKKNNVACVIVK